MDKIDQHIISFFVALCICLAAQTSYATDINQQLLDRGSPSLPSEAYGKKQSNYSAENCVKTWQKRSVPIPEEAITTLCHCVEKEAKSSPLGPNKSSKLAGPDGMQNLGPWPNIYEKCVDQFLLNLIQSSKETSE